MTLLKSHATASWILNRQYQDNRSISNIIYTMPIRGRSYAVEFSSPYHMPKSSGYHPPRDDLDDDLREKYKYRSKMRAKKKFRDLALANDFRYMLTLTLNPSHPRFHSMNDPKNIRRVFKDIHRNNGHLYRYLGVCELQKNGNVHLHILCTKELKRHLRINDFGFLEFIPWIKYGYTNLRKLNKSDYVKQISYVSKYLTKSESNGQSYFRTRDLATPIVKYNGNLENMVVDIQFELDYDLVVSIYKEK